MHKFLALFIARNKEFYRDRAALSWSLLLPVFIVTAVAFAFSGGERPLFKVGYVGEQPALPLLAQPYVTPVAYADTDQALVKIQHQQIDLLLAADSGDYWINDQSSHGALLEELLLNQQPGQWQRQAVSGREIRYVDWVIPGVLGMNMMFGALFGVGYVIVRYRKNGVLKRLQATPVKPVEFLGAQVASRLIMLLGVSVFIYLGCDLFLDFLMLGSYWLLLLVGLLGCLSMISLALIFSSRTASEELAHGLLNLATFPMLLLSEVWFSLDGAPEWMREFAQIFPLTHLVKAAREVMLNGATLMDIAPHLLVLAAMSAVFITFASLMFRWKPR